MRRLDFIDLILEDSGVQYTAIPATDVLEACAAEPHDYARANCLYNALVEQRVAYCTQPETIDNDV